MRVFFPIAHFAGRRTIGASMLTRPRTAFRFAQKRMRLSRKAFVRFQLLYAQRCASVSAKTLHDALCFMMRSMDWILTAVVNGIQLEWVSSSTAPIEPAGIVYGQRLAARDGICTPRAEAALHNEMHAFTELLEGRAGIVRAGPNAKECGDPFDAQGTFEIMGDGFAILKAYAGPVSGVRVQAAIRSLNAVGLKVRWERLDGRARVIEQIEAEGKFSMPSTRERKHSRVR
jgi:hypothetical protein